MRATSVCSAAALAVLSGVVVACGPESTPTSGPAPASGPASAASSSAEAEAPPDRALVATRAVAGIRHDPECPEPGTPMYAATETYGIGIETEDVAPPEGASLSVLAEANLPPDTDGDGAPDAVDRDGEHVTLGRADGELVLREPGGVVGFRAGTRTGDLDGDGADEIAVFTTGSRQNGHYDTVLVPGATPPGEHDPVSIGIVLPHDDFGVVWGVGDQNGDGADDVAVGDDVFSGRDLLAPGPGGVLTERPSPLRTIDGGFEGVLRLTPDAPPVFVAAGETDREARQGVELAVLTEPAVRLTIDRLEPPSGQWGTDGTVRGFVSDGDRIVSYEWGAGRSGYSATWMWNLDDPCAGPTPAG